MFHPSAPTSLSLSDSFTLRYVTTPSSAVGFTPTTALSVDPLSITHTSLCCLGLGCRSYNGPVPDGPSPGKITHFHCPPTSSTLRNTERISGFGNRGYLALSAKPTRGSHRAWVANLARASFRSLIGSLSPIYPSSGRSKEFLRAPLLSPTYSLLSGLWLDLHQLVRDHAGHTSSMEDTINF